MCLGVFLFGLLLYGTLHFLDLAISFPKLKRFSIIIYSHIFLAPFFISSSEVTIMQILVGWMLSQRLLQTVLIFFFLFCSVAVVTLEKAMAPHSSTLAWKIPWAEEPGMLQSHGVTKSQTRLNDFPFTFHFDALEKEMATHSSVLAWRIPGTREPGGLPSMGQHRVRHDWSDLAAAVVPLTLSSS